ncbi:MAG: hypothetical protein HQK63_06515 [Desulfamplus sp.]|nr:hypothetical protein [Desulfamplus sp.]
MIFSSNFNRFFYLLIPALILSVGICFIADPTSAKLSGSTQSITLTIDPASERKPISPYLYGINIANWCPSYYTHSVEQRLRDAKVEVVRLGATNMERYNFKNNMMYNVITKQNEYLSLSWESFVEWTLNDLNAEPFLQASIFGNVASDSEVNQDSAATDGITDGDSYSHHQTSEEVMEWVQSAGDDVRFWGIGNEPWIAWKRSDYPSLYADAAHGDQVLNAHISYDYYFNRFTTVAEAIKTVNPAAGTLGPTPANWWLYWFNDYSPLCPVKEAGADAGIDDTGWQVMANPDSTYNKSVFPDRGGDPEIAGWETDPQKSLPQYLQRMRQHETESKKRIADYMDVHRYIRCITEYDAVQEPRGLFQEDFASWDMETLFSGLKTNLLNRLNWAIDSYYPETLLSFSEYGYFYWDGYPSIPQISATTQIDFLGFFARGGVNLACNWYVGEPNQSGEDLTHAQQDSAKQAMFDESGNPNPKYWAFYMMSNFFRGTSVKAESNDWERFSVHACENENGDYVVFAVNKGSYDKATGDYIPNQPPVSAVIDFSSIVDQSVTVPVASNPLTSNLSLKRLFRYGLDDPYVVEMDTKGVQNSSETSTGDYKSFTFDFEPLAIYAFIFSNNQKQSDNNILPNDNLDSQSILATPSIIHFSAYETGQIINGDSTSFTHAIKITNKKSYNPSKWSIKTDPNRPSWLTIQGLSNSIDAGSGIIHGNSGGGGTYNLNGETAVTDSVYLTVDRTGLTSGTYETEIFVNTGSGEAEQSAVKVIMDIIPMEENGEKRIADFETGSLAHTLNIKPPYSVGWWDGHGMPNDRNLPYLYDFSIEKIDQYISDTSDYTVAIKDNAIVVTRDVTQINRLGGKYCMKIEFDRSNGDTENGRLYQSFGTYGHNNSTSNWEGYDAFEFDIKTDTIDSTHTDLLMILSDKSGNKGKPAINITGIDNISTNGNISTTNSNLTTNLTNHTDIMKVEDGHWQTITIPLKGRFFDWRYPQGQNGSETVMDFANISQIEFVPWSGDAAKKGGIWLDNLRLTKADGENNHFPVAVIEKKSILIKPEENVTLNASQSYDPDQEGEIESYMWISSNNLSNTENSEAIEKLSDAAISSPIFSSSEEGIYRYDLVVKDREGLESRNIAQVVITVSQKSLSDEAAVSIGGGSSGQGCFISTIIGLDSSGFGSNGNKTSSGWILFFTIIALSLIVGAFMKGIE